MHYGTAGVAALISAKLLFSYLVITPAKAYRILAYEPSVGHSHWNVMSAVLESLVDAGHEVVCVTIHPVTDHLSIHPNYTHVDVSKIIDQLNSTARDWDFTQIMRVFSSRASMIWYATDRIQRMCALLSGMPEIRDILDGHRFDAIVMESLFSKCQSLLLFGRLALPTVYVVPSSPVNWMPMATGSPDHPSYLGTLMSGHPTPGTFVQRLLNAVDYANTNLVRWYKDSWVRSDDHRRKWPTDRNTMVFVNTHHSVEPARPLGPNIVEIGGIHLQRAPTSLPRVCCTRYSKPRLLCIYIDFI